MQLSIIICQLVFLYFSAQEVRTEYIGDLKEISIENQSGTISPLSNRWNPSIYKNGEFYEIWRDEPTQNGDDTERKMAYKFEVSDIRYMAEKEVVFTTDDVNKTFHVTFYGDNIAQALYDSVSSNALTDESKPEYKLKTVKKNTSGEFLDEAEIYVEDRSTTTNRRTRRFIIRSIDDKQPYLIFSSNYFTASAARGQNKDWVILAIDDKSPNIRFFSLQFEDGKANDFVAAVCPDVCTDLNEKIPQNFVEYLETYK